MPPAPSLDTQLAAFARRRFLAMPLAGTIAWSAVGVAGLLLPPRATVHVRFVATGVIAWLGIFLSRFTGEHFLDRTRPRNPFDALFFMAVGMSLLVYAIAIPFFLVDDTSLPLSVGVLSGLMWMPMSWLLQHWVGIAHAVARTLLGTAAWFVWPSARFVAVPAVIVELSLLVIGVLEARWRGLAGVPGGSGAPVPT